MQPIRFGSVSFKHLNDYGDSVGLTFRLRNDEKGQSILEYANIAMQPGQDEVFLRFNKQDDEIMLYRGQNYKTPNASQLARIRQLLEEMPAGLDEHSAQVFQEKVVDAYQRRLDEDAREDRLDRLMRG